MYEVADLRSIVYDFSPPVRFTLLTCSRECECLNQQESGCKAPGTSTQPPSIFLQTLFHMRI